MRSTVLAIKVKNSGRPLDNQTNWHMNGWPQQKLLKFGIHTINTTAL